MFQELLILSPELFLVVYLTFRKVLRVIYNHCVSFIDQCSRHPSDSEQSAHFLCWWRRLFLIFFLLFFFLLFFSHTIHHDPLFPPSLPPSPDPICHEFFREHRLDTFHHSFPHGLSFDAILKFEFLTVVFVTYRKQENWNTQYHSHAFVIGRHFCQFPWQIFDFQMITGTLT